MKTFVSNTNGLDTFPESTVYRISTFASLAAFLLETSSVSIPWNVGIISCKRECFRQSHFVIHQNPARGSLQ